MPTFCRCKASLLFFGLEPAADAKSTLSLPSADVRHDGLLKLLQYLVHDEQRGQVGAESLDIPHPKGDVKESAEAIERVKDENFEDQMIEMLSFGPVILKIGQTMS